MSPFILTSDVSSVVSKTFILTSGVSSVARKTNFSDIHVYSKYVDNDMFEKCWEQLLVSISVI